MATSSLPGHWVDPVQGDARPPEAADVVVIGAGMVGVSAAHALWDQWPGEMGAEMGFRRSGLVYVTRDAKELDGWRDWVEMSRKYQVPVRMIDAEEARRIAPGRPRDWVGGVVSPRDGRAEPGLAAPAIARAGHHWRADQRRVHRTWPGARADRDQGWRHLVVDVPAAPRHRPADGLGALHRLRHHPGAAGDTGRVLFGGSLPDPAAGRRLHRGRQGAHPAGGEAGGHPLCPAVLAVAAGQPQAG